LHELATLVPTRVVLCSRLDESMSHLIEAGSDFFVMPSRFEPCGLNQMYSQAYGTVPLVTQVGGLIDTVVDIDRFPAAGTGVMFSPCVAGLAGGLARALKLFVDKPLYAEVQARGMRTDFGWEKTAKAYEDLYRDTI
jgi:starch synthase